MRVKASEGGNGASLNIPGQDHKVKTYFKLHSKGQINPHDLFSIPVDKEQ